MKSKTEDGKCGGSCESSTMGGEGRDADNSKERGENMTEGRGELRLNHADDTPPTRPNLFPGLRLLLWQPGVSPCSQHIPQARVQGWCDTYADTHARRAHAQFERGMEIACRVTAVWILQQFSLKHQHKNSFYRLYLRICHTPPKK